MSFGARRRVLAGALVVLSGCSTTASQTETETAPASAPARSPSGGPRLVVSIVLDQVGSWALERHLTRLPKDGLLRRAMEEGVWHPRVSYPYGATITAAGHATLYTGVAPRVHGVVANDRFDPARGEKRALVDDGEHRIFGVPGFASPTVLKAPTVADRLHEATGGAAKIVSLSLKDRAAILPAGQHADFVAFYEKRLPGFTSSSFYFEALPEWFLRWREAHPVDHYLEPWTPLESTRALASPEDDRAVEGVFGGFDRTFPHEPAKGENPGSLLRFTPASTRYLFDLALAAVEAEALGADEVPDLLALSVSATDYVGHAYGVESLEYLDNLVRTDRMLGELVKALEARTTVAVVITSDHGSAPLPAADPPPRLSPEALVPELESALEERFGAGPHVLGYHVPYIYLSAAARARPEVVDATIELLEARDAVRLVARSEEAASWSSDRSSVKRAIALGIDLERAGALYVLPEDGVIVDPNLGGGTNHGTPYAYDVEVPVLALGVGVRSVRASVPLDVRQVAPSLAALLGIAPPEGATQPPLPGIGEVPEE